MLKKRLKTKSMARPRKTVAEGMNPDPATEREMAPLPTQSEPSVSVVEKEIVYVPVYTPPAPRQMRVQRQNAEGVPSSRRFPNIIGGVCEFCGVIDANQPSQYQYKLCSHYRGMQAWCSYCPSSKDPDDVAYHANLNVREDPYRAGELLMWCDSYECSRKHLEKFKQLAAI